MAACRTLNWAERKLLNGSTKTLNKARNSASASLKNINEIRGGRTAFPGVIFLGGGKGEIGKLAASAGKPFFGFSFCTLVLIFPQSLAPSVFMVSAALRALPCAYLIK